MRSRPTPTALLAAAGGVAVVTIAIYPLRELMPAVATGVIYMLPVLLVSSLWGLWPGVATSVASAAALNFFHIPPTGRFTIADEQNWVALIVFLIAAVVTSTLAGTARARAEEAERRRREADSDRRDGSGAARRREPRRDAAGGRPADRAGFEIPWVSVEAAWTDSDERRRALPIVVDGVRTARSASRATSIRRSSKRSSGGCSRASRRCSAPPANARAWRPSWSRPAPFDARTWSRRRCCDRSHTTCVHR